MMEKINKILLRLSCLLSVFVWLSHGVHGQDIDPLAPSGQDYEALKALYEATGGDNWNNNTGWDFSGSVSVASNWNGITVENGRVTRLLLSHNRLTGEIPAELGNLTELEYFGLSNNQLTGNIPTEVTNFSKLKTFSLRENKLTGLLPEDVGSSSSMKEIYLQGNQLTGEISGNYFTKYPNMRHLFLNDNQLTGNIPTNIDSLFLQQHPLTAAATQVWLQNNQLSGMVPMSIVNIRGW